jgi:agmatine deiminase
MSNNSLPSQNRRSTLSGLAAFAATFTVPTVAWSQGPSPSYSAPLRIPGEFEPARALWLGYDAGHKDLTAALVSALSPHVKIKHLVSSIEDAAALSELLQQRDIRVIDADIFIKPSTKYFLRDVASLAVRSNSSLGCVSYPWSDYGLSGWCRQRYTNSPAQVQSCSGEISKVKNETGEEIARLTRATHVASKLYIEGGGIEVNGTGLIIANERLLRQRNHGVSILSLEKGLLALPGVRKVIWLPEGLAEDPQGRATIIGNYVAWGTGGHTDEFVRFADASTVLLAWPDEADATSHPVTRLNQQRMKRNFDILSRSLGTKGEPLRVIKVPMPKLIERRVFLSASADRSWSHEWTADFFPPNERRREGDAVVQIASASYLNFVIANDVIVAPEYTAHGTSRATQERVRRILEGAFKGRKVLFVDAMSANWVGGGPHCATLKEPLI